MQTTHLVSCALVLGLAIPAPAFAWGDLGHKVVGEIAMRHLDPAVRARVDDLLSGPPLPSSPSEFTALGNTVSSRTVFADRYRDSDRKTTNIRYNATRAWHFADIDLVHPDVGAVCPPAPPTTVPASQAPANACVIQKVEAFAAELRDPSVSRDEKIVALNFLLHFVGDLHQPLHAATKDDDRGGNLRFVTYGSGTRTNLHSYWDTVAMKALGSDATAIAGQLDGAITPTNIAAWQMGGARDWALEANAIARRTTYKLPNKPVGSFTVDPNKPPQPHFELSDSYAASTKTAVRLQLSRAGIRLAKILNETLAAP